MRDGENFFDWYRRCWYADELGDAAYGQKSVIARIRRGKYVTIPAEWRGKVPTDATIRKRQSKRLRKHRRGPKWVARKNIAKGSDRLSNSEKRALTAEQELDMLST